MENHAPIAQRPLKRILLVDDAVTVRMYCRQILEAAGYTVSEALNGLEGLENALVDTPDLLLVDVNMPMMDGYTMLHQLRRQPPPIMSLPAVMISTESHEDDSERAYTAGANYYMCKPVRPADLLSVVRLVLGDPAP